MHWPNGFKSKGEIRSQWHHVNDIASTILEATKLPEPKMINGVKQIPLDGVSMLYATDNSDAEERHIIQYFEMFGNRAIYNEGWLARVIHRLPWNPKTINTLQEDIWELYNTDEDFSLTENLAETNPEKLKELIELFEKEAISNNVYPLDDRTYDRFNAEIAGRPDLMQGRTSLTLSQGMAGIMENAFINVKNKSITITANLELEGNDRGIILCQGGKFGGWALYMDDGKLAYTYNWVGLETYTIKSSTSIPKGNTNVKLDFIYDGGGSGKGGVASLYVGGKKVGEGKIGQTNPFLFSADETADVAKDEATQVVYTVFKDVKDSEFTGHVNTVEVKIPEE